MSRERRGMAVGDAQVAGTVEKMKVGEVVGTAGVGPR